MTNLIAPYASLAISEERRMAEIIIFGDITSSATGLWSDIWPEDVSAYSIVEQLNSIPDDYSITVRINSNGGEVKEGLAIYNALKKRDVTTVCEGFAASAASVIFMAGKRRVMNAASLLFIHQAIVYASGNPDELEKVADDLRTITSAAAAAYKEGGVTLSDEEIDAKMKAETWITAEDAVKWGFATEIDQRTENEGVVTNSAMKSVIKAVTRKSPVLGNIKVCVDTGELEKLVNKLENKLDNVVAFCEDTGKNPKQKETKPFFNLKKED